MGNYNVVSIESNVYRCGRCGDPLDYAIINEAVYISPCKNCIDSEGKRIITVKVCDGERSGTFEELLIQSLSAIHEEIKRLNDKLPWCG